MLRSTLHLAAAVLWLVADGVRAQSLNIDFDESPGEAASAPLASFVGALGQPGFWNAVPASDLGPIPLLDLAGQARGVVFDRIGGEGGFTFDNPNTTGEHHFLLDDLINVGFEGDATTIRLSGLVPGVYRVITYAISPDNPMTDRTSVSISGATGTNPQRVGGAMPSNSFSPGITHSDHTVDAEGGFIAIRASAAAGYGSVNGLQMALLAPRRLYVKPEAAAGGDGTSWAGALRTLTEALGRAAASQDAVREIWVARGTYRPSATNAAATFAVPRGVRVYGGFVGDETRLSRRDVGVYRTVLSGRLDSGARSRWVAVLNSGAGPLPNGPAALDGFTIEDGGTSGPDSGGVKIVGSGELFRCVLRGHAGAGGGAVRAEGTATVVGCEFVSNTATDGAAVFASGPVTLLNCLMHANAASGRGGAAYLGAGGTLTGVAAWGNEAAEGAGVYVTGGALGLTNCTIALNQGGIGAGVLAAGPVGPPVTVRNSVVFGNRESRPNPASLREQNLASASWPSGIDGSRNLVEGFLAGPLLLTTGADPIFVDDLGSDGAAFTGDEDVALNFGSPAIDAGDTTVLPRDAYDLDGDGDANEPLPVDATQRERLADDPATADTGCCEAPVVDLGAIEFAPPPACPADFNQDGGVDGGDVEAFFLVWQEGDSGADVNRDGGVDGGDVETFFVAWEAGGC